MPRPRNALNVTEPERQRIRELYHEGIRITEIIRRTGRCESVVYRAVQGLRRPRPRPKGSAKIARRNRLIVQRFRESVPQGVLARRFRLTPTMVCYIVRTALRLRPKRGSQGKAKKKVTKAKPVQAGNPSQPWSELTRAQKTARERYVLDRVEKGATLGAIARRYGMSPAAVAGMVARVRARRKERNAKVARLVLEESVATAVVARRFGMSARRVATILRQ